MEDNMMTPADFVKVINRRKWSLIIPMVLIVLISCITALLLPSVYRSTSTILIEEQDIPQEYVMATMTAYAEQRIQSVNQRIMSSSILTDLINRFNLYSELRKKKTMDEVIAEFKDNIHLEPVSAEIVDRRTGRPATAIIAFTISYEGEVAKKTQQVASELTSMFLREDLQVRERQTKETAFFLEGEKDRIKDQLDKAEASLAVFKAANINSLPELFQVNIQELSVTERSIERVSEQLNALKERMGYIETQLASVPAMLDSENELRLEQLDIQLVTLKTRFSDHYPDVIKLKNEIEEIKKVIAQEKRIAGGNPDNPAHITLASQLASIKSEVSSVEKQKQDLERLASVYRKRISATPKVEEDYNALAVEIRGLQVKYDDLQRKVMEAKVAQGLESEQKGERFSLIEPARLPEKPFKPNRIAIVLIGVVLGAGAGVGLAALREFTDDSIKDMDSLSMMSGFPVLACIPVIVTASDRLRSRIKFTAIILLAAVGVGAAVLIFHNMVMDLDVFWAKFTRKFL